MKATKTKGQVQIRESKYMCALSAWKPQPQGQMRSKIVIIRISLALDFRCKIQDNWTHRDISHDPL